MLLKVSILLLFILYFLRWDVERASHFKLGELMKYWTVPIVIILAFGLVLILIVIGETPAPETKAETVSSYQVYTCTYCGGNISMDRTPEGWQMKCLGGKTTHYHMWCSRIMELEKQVDSLETIVHEHSYF